MSFNTSNAGTGTNLSSPDGLVFKQNGSEIVALGNVFDAIPTENYESDLQTTQYSIETGATLTDQAVLKPKTVTLLCYITPVQVKSDSSLQGVFRDEQGWQKILEYQRSFELTTVVTLLGTYENMVLTSATTEKSDSAPTGTLIATLVFEQILVANTQSTKLPASQLSTGLARNSSNVARGEVQSQGISNQAQDDAALKIFNYFTT